MAGLTVTRGTRERIVMVTAVTSVAGLAALASVWTAHAHPVARGTATAAPHTSASKPKPKPKSSGKQSEPSKPIPGQTSVPDASLPAPRVSMDIAHASDKGAHAVNITIDDGPDPVWTPKILRVLKENGVKAVFCMIGPQAAAHPEIVRQVVAAGHRLCDHTVSHDTTMATKSRAYQSKEVLDAEQMIEAASGGVKPLYYRAPGGAFTPYSRQIAAARAMRPLGWNVDSKDFDRPGAAALVATVKNELPNGPTVLFHDGGGDRGQTVAALRQLLPWLKQHGYSFGFPVR